MNALRISVGSVRLASRLEAQVRASCSVSLRYAVPAFSVSSSVQQRGPLEDVVVAACRQVSDDGTALLFNHVSTHPMRLTARMLPELMAQPLQLQLLLEGTQPAFRRRGGGAVAPVVSLNAPLAVGQVALQEALGRGQAQS